MCLQELTMEKLIAEADLKRTLGTLRYLEGLKAVRQQSLAAASNAGASGACLPYGPFPRSSISL